jgi:hypothetical protein
LYAAVVTGRKTRMGVRRLQYLQGNDLAFWIDPSGAAAGGHVFHKSSGSESITSPNKVPDFTWEAA